MRPLYLLFLSVAVAAWVSSCSKSDDASSTDTSGLASPRVAAQSSGAMYSGYLDVYPCISGTSTYYGNYMGTPPKLTALNAIYQVVDGAALSGIGRPVLLPLGTYDMIYWGFMLPSDTTITPPAVGDPQIVLGGNLSQQSYSLTPWTAGDTLYNPVYDYVYALKSVRVGSDSMAVNLTRAVAAISIMLRPADTTSFNTKIDTISVTLGSVAKNLNLYTAVASNQTGTVLIPMRFGTGRVNAYNTVAVFPTGDAPQLQIRLTLNTGEMKTYTTNLSQALTAGTMLLLSVNIGTIYTTPSSSGDGFSVSDWHETSQTIDTGPLY